MDGQRMDVNTIFCFIFLFWNIQFHYLMFQDILPAPTEIVQKGSADIDKLIY